MEFQPAGWVSVSVFVTLAVGMAYFCWRAIGLVTEWKKWLALFLLLVVVISWAALSGAVARAFIPLGPVLFAFIFLFGFFFSFGRPGKQLAMSLPFTVLIGFQGFRLPLELVLHEWAAVGTVPETMTWTGKNWDILTGVLSLVAIPWVKNHRLIARVANAIGFFLLLNVIRVVILSAPLPFAWPLERPLVLIAYFPYCLIGPLFVLPALVGHLVTFRKLIGKKR